MYNHRKLSELPFHLINSLQFEKFRDLCGTNFEFLQGLVIVYSVFDAIRMFKHALDKMDIAGEIDLPEVYRDLDNVLKILLLSAENIRRDRNNLAVEVSRIISCNLIQCVANISLNEKIKMDRATINHIFLPVLNIMNECQVAFTIVDYFSPGYELLRIGCHDVTC